MEKKREIRTDLLRELANHLINGKLGHKVFSFSLYNDNQYDEPEIYGNRCGTMGCAVGEMPILWPDKFVFDGGFVIPKHCRDNEDVFTAEIAKFFGITSRMYNHLFLPVSQNSHWGYFLQMSATKEQVAENIIKFCDLAEGGNL